MAKPKQAAKEQEVINPLAFLGDWEAPEDHATEIPISTVQWLNGLGPAFKQVSPLLASGGWEFPLQLFGNVFGESQPVLQVPHGINKDILEDGYILPCIHVAILESRFIWEKGTGASKEYSYRYQEGYRGRLNIYALVKELGNTDPVLLTLHGTVTGFFKATTKSHLNQVVRCANRYGQGRRFPQYLFWAPIAVGEKEEVGTSITNSVTPPVPAWDEAAFTGDDPGKIAQAMQDLYIGEELRDLITNQLYDEAIAWGESWDAYMQKVAIGGETGNGKPNKPPAMHETDEAGYLIIPETPETVPEWLRWGESAMGLEHGDAGNIFSKMLRSNRLDPTKNDNNKNLAWVKWVDLVLNEFNQLNGIQSDAEIIQQLIS